MNDDSKKTAYDKSLYTEPARRERFKRVAERRTNKILDGLRLLGNTGNKTLYIYTEEEVQKIFSAIERKLIEVKGKFRTGKSSEKFRL